MCDLVIICFFIHDNHPGSQNLIEETLPGRRRVRDDPDFCGKSLKKHGSITGPWDYDYNIL